jgi:acetolactate synthase-1/2/3 large subunit
MSNDNADLHVEGHAGQQAVAALMAFGTDTMFTLNGGHIWPLYDAARDQGMKVVDTRHEQTATFAAEAYAKLTRKPGFAALTAGPGITNGVSATTTSRTSTAPHSWCSAAEHPRRAGAAARCRSSTTCP